MGLEATLAVGSQASLQCSGLLETARDANQSKTREFKRNTLLSQFRQDLKAVNITLRIRDNRWWK